MLQHPGEFDDKYPSGGGVTPVLSVSVLRDKGVPSNTTFNTSGGLSQGVSLEF